MIETWRSSTSPASFRISASRVYITLKRGPSVSVRSGALIAARMAVSNRQILGRPRRTLRALPCRGFVEQHHRVGLDHADYLPRLVAGEPTALENGL